MIAEMTIPEQAGLASAHPPSAAIELRASGGIATLPLNRPQPRNAIGDAMRAGPARTMDGLEALQ